MNIKCQFADNSGADHFMDRRSLNFIWSMNFTTFVNVTHLSINSYPALPATLQVVKCITNRMV
jgi:hypothetical protein